MGTEGTFKVTDKNLLKLEINEKETLGKNCETVLLETKLLSSGNKILRKNCRQPVSNYEGTLRKFRATGKKPIEKHDW